MPSIAASAGATAPMRGCCMGPCDATRAAPAGWLNAVDLLVVLNAPLLEHRLARHLEHLVQGVPHDLLLEALRLLGIARDLVLIVAVRVVAGVVDGRKVGDDEDRAVLGRHVDLNMYHNSIPCWNGVTTLCGRETPPAMTPCGAAGVSKSSPFATPTTPSGAARVTQTTEGNNGRPRPAGTCATPGAGCARPRPGSTASSRSPPGPTADDGGR